MTFTAISFNLRHDKPDPKDFNWRVRRPAVAALIAHYRPHLIGTQEGKANQLLDLHRLLPDYQSVGVDRRNDGTDEHCAIFYRRDLRCLDSSNFALSDTPERLGSIAPEWEHRVPRMATQATFAVPGLDGELVCYNTHLDHESAIAREKGAALIMERLAHFTEERYHWLVTGDFNDTPGSAARVTFEQPRAGHALLDALRHLDLDAQKSIHAYTGNPFAAIDTLYYDRRWKLESAAIDRDRWQDVLVSDHFPALATFTLP